MLMKPLIKLAIAIVAATTYTAVAKPTLPVPTSGLYRIQSASSGLFMDAEQASQAPGTRVIVFPLNQPLTTNQEWTLDVFDGEFATIQSVSSFVLDTTSSTGGLVLTLDPNLASGFTLIPVPAGVQICTFPTAVSCLASPTDPITQIPLEPFSNAPNQTWIFEIVG